MCLKSLKNLFLEYYHATAFVVKVNRRAAVIPSVWGRCEWRSNSLLRVFTLDNESLLFPLLLPSAKVATYRAQLHLTSNTGKRGRAIDAVGCCGLKLSVLLVGLRIPFSPSKCHWALDKQWWRFPRGAHTIYSWPIII